MPGGCQWTGLSLAVSHRDGDDEVRIVESCSVGVRDRVPKLATFMNRPWRFRGAVRADPSRKGKLLKEFEHTRFVTALIRIDFGIMPFQIAVGESGGRAVAGT